VTEVARIDVAEPSGWTPALMAAVEALRAGCLVILPTETVYGLACRPDLPAATEGVFLAKRRSRDLNLPVLAPSADATWEMGERSPVAEALAARFWPGPLTLVLPRTGRSAAWALGDREDSIGVRVPDHAFTQALLQLAGPLAATSANVSGREPLRTPTELTGAFGRRVAVYVVARSADGSDAVAAAGVPSTVVDVTGGRIELLREGSIDRGRILAALV
jgi:L-threonylcarbamoyladenylate synthase